MGQKVNPHGLRVGVIKDWDSRWFTTDKKEFGSLLLEDHQIRTFLKERLYVAGVAKIEIERSANKIRIDLHVAKPGVVIGAAGAKIEALKAELEKMTKKTVIVNIIEVKGIDRNAQLVAENIALAIERRVAFRRAMKQSIQRAMKLGAKGVKTACSGRLGGAEMARTEGYSEGNVPLQTLRSDIDYGFAEADTTYGKIGIKVWICNGEVLPTRNGVNPREERKDNRRDRRDNKRDNRRRDSRGNGRGQRPQGQRPQRTENKENYDKQKVMDEISKKIGSLVFVKDEDFNEKYDTTEVSILSQCTKRTQDNTGYMYLHQKIADKINELPAELQEYAICATLEGMGSNRSVLFDGVTTNADYLIKCLGLNDAKDLEEYLSHVNKDGSSDFSEFLNSQYEQNDFIMAVVNAELNEIGRGVSSGRN